MPSAASIIQELGELDKQLLASLENARSHKDLEDVRIEYLGKKGKLTQILKQLGKVSESDRAQIGKHANELKAKFETDFTQRSEKIEQDYYDNLAKEEWFDATIIPPRFPKDFLSGPQRGHVHPISHTQKRLEQIFTSMGFSILAGPQVETDYNNFEALNFTKDHPAREMHDTIYTGQDHLLRTHTSTVQSRAMKILEPPMRIIVPGRVFRYEELDASHEHTFYQMEGMVIDKTVSISNLLHLMNTLLEEIFERQVEVRLRPGYFPFVEPAFELDMKCLICGGKGCPVCKYSGWSEVLPCGLVHPNVIKYGGLDPDKWQGAAFGLGLDRLVMMHHGIEDIRLFHGANPAFLYQFLKD